MKRAYVTICSNEKYFPGVIALDKSLRNVNSKHPLVVLLSKKVSESFENRLHSMGFNILRLNHAIEVPNSVTELNVINDNIFWNATFDKLLIFSLTEFEKIVYLDSDMLIVRNIDDLFDKPHMSAVVADKSYPGNEKWVELNSGCMVIVPQEGLDKLLLNTLWEYDNSNHRIRGDQDVIQLYYKEWKNTKNLQLDEGYNVFFRHIKHYNKIGYSIKQGKIKIIHFIGRKKPWEYTLKRIIRTYAALALKFNFEGLYAFYTYRKFTKVKE